MTFLKSTEYENNNEMIADAAGSGGHGKNSTKNHPREKGAKKPRGFYPKTPGYFTLKTPGISTKKPRVFLP